MSRVLSQGRQSKTEARILTQESQRQSKSFQQIATGQGVEGELPFPAGLGYCCTQNKQLDFYISLKAYVTTEH